MLLNNTGNSRDHCDNFININVNSNAKENILLHYICMSCESLSTFCFQITENISDCNGI